MVTGSEPFRGDRGRRLEVTPQAQDTPVATPAPSNPEELIAARPQAIDACWVCVNDWCVMGGSKEFRDTLRERLASADVPIPVKEWDCFGFCQKAPNIVLYPQGTWFTGVRPEDMEAILAHLQGGELSAELAARVNPKLHAILLHYLDHCFARGITREVE